MRFAPAASIRRAVCPSRMPPAALTPIVGETLARMSRTCSSVAPPGPNPVDVFT